MINKAITIKDYLKFVNKTDRLPKDNLSPVLQGLFGEIGGLMTAAKKLIREPKIYACEKIVVEEFGDAFWYLCCLSNRLNINIQSVLLTLIKENIVEPEILIGSDNTPISIVYKKMVKRKFEEILIDLGQLTGNFLNPEFLKEGSLDKLALFLKTFFDAIHVLNLNFSKIIVRNMDKVSSRFIKSKNSKLPTFDKDFPEFERLPEKFEIEFISRTNSQSAMRWNKVFIGDPLTDSIKNEDSYRFHDVFHFAFASILHWSPTFRALIKHKRKSKPEIDRTQDGGRAIVVEEGLSAWIFTIAKENKYFEGRNSLTFDMLKNIEQFIKGFEVEACPLILWEEAILSGYCVFRKVVKNNGGVVVGDRKKRTITFRKKL